MGRKFSNIITTNMIKLFALFFFFANSVDIGKRYTPAVELADEVERNIVKMVYARIYDRAVTDSATISRCIDEFSGNNELNKSLQMFSQSSRRNICNASLRSFSNNLRFISKQNTEKKDR